MRQHFPPVDAASRDWQIVSDGTSVQKQDLAALLNTYIPGDNVLVEVHRMLGTCLPKSEAATFIAEHIGKGNIRVADRDFGGFVYVAVNGVATGWAGT
jgi:hypothetical protein